MLFLFAVVLFASAATPILAMAQMCEPYIVPCNYGKYYSGTVTWTSLVEVNTPDLKHSSRLQVTATITDGKVSCTGSESLSREDRESRYTGEGPVSGSGFLVVEKPYADPADRSGKYEISVWCPISERRWRNVPKREGDGPPTSGVVPGRPADVRSEAGGMIYEHETADYFRLAGTETYEHPDADAVNHVTGTITITWNLSLSEDVTLIVRPQEYGSWKPEPGADEGTPGPHPLTVTLELRGKGGKPPRSKVDHFELELRDTSHEPGIALNMPLAPAGEPGPDLRLLSEGGATVGDEGQSATVPSQDGKTGKVTIAAFDGGGWSTLVAKAVLDNGTPVTGHLETPDGPTEVLLPKREASSKIASSWLADNENPRDDADIETTLGNPNPGDGLSAYEEYRGLVAKREYKRLDPRRRELAVEASEEFSKGGGAAGLSLFENASNIEVVELRPGELDQDRVVNRNAGNAHLVAQHALRLEKGSLAEGEAGVNQPKEKKGKTPKDSQRVVIDVAQIVKHVLDQAAEAAAANVRMPYTFEKYLEVTIAHEIAHGVGVDHHGPSSDQPKRTVEPYQTGFRIYGSDRRPIIVTQSREIANIGSQGGDSSGDLGCLMAYTDMYQWAYAREGDLNVYRKLPLLPLGNRFCTSTDGTGINAADPGPSYFGPATWGDCAAKLRVRD